jgi:predicted DNA-binding transcriptional regulator AlpA
MTPREVHDARPFGGLCSFFGQVMSPSEKSRKRALKDSTSITNKAEVAPPRVRLLDKHEVLAITGTSYVTLWNWMIAKPPKFPRSFIAGGRSVWRSDEIAAWLENLPRRPLKGDHQTVGARA